MDAHYFAVNPNPTRPTVSTRHLSAQALAPRYCFKVAVLPAVTKQHLAHGDRPLELDAKTDQLLAPTVDLVAQRVGARARASTCEGVSLAVRACLCSS